MLGVKSYTQEYVDSCRARVEHDLTAFRALAAAARQQAGGDKAVEAFEGSFFANLVLVLDAMFMHRMRTREGKDGNAMNEVRVLCASMLTNDNRMSVDKTIKMPPAKTVLKYEVGDAINLTESGFVALSEAFFAEIERKFVESAA